MSWVCILGAIVLVMGVWFLTLPRSNQYDALEYWKGTGAKPKPKAAPKPMAKPAPKAAPINRVAGQVAPNNRAAPKPKPKAGVRVLVKPRAMPLAAAPSKTTPRM